jgi:hypothetical protein
MRRLVLLVVAAISGSSGLFAQATISVPLRNPRAAVDSTYAQIASRPLADRRSLYATLPASMQDDLWSLQLSYFLEEHPDLDPAQKALVFEALGLFQSGLLEADRSSATWRTSTLAAVEQLEGRARIEGSKGLMDALSQLGGPEIVNPTTRAGGIRSEISVGGECECSTVSDYCCFLDCPTSPWPNCHRTRPYCYPTHGCGLGWVYDCNGICGS